jgi:hypothetical protein
MSFLGIKNPFRTGAGQVTRAAGNAAAARQGRASNLTTFIDNTFSDPRREAQTQDFMGALRSQLGDATNRGYANVSRGTKFRTARQGLTGGRVDVDRQGRNLEALFSARLGDEARVQDAGNEIRSQDRATRQSLIDSAYGAADVGQDAMRRFIGQQGANSQRLGLMLPQFASRVGGDIAGGYSRRAEMDAYRRGVGGVE